MTDMVVVTELPLELNSGEAGRKARQFHPKHSSKVKGWLACMPPTFHPGVENQQVTGQHLGKPALGRRRIAVREGFKFRVNVHSLQPGPLLMALWEVPGKSAAGPSF